MNSSSADSGRVDHDSYSEQYHGYDGQSGYDKNRTTWQTRIRDVYSYWAIRTMQCEYSL